MPIEARRVPSLLTRGLWSIMNSALGEYNCDVRHRPPRIAGASDQWVGHGIAIRAEPAFLWRRLQRRRRIARTPASGRACFVSCHPCVGAHVKSGPESRRPLQRTASEL